MSRKHKGPPGAWSATQGSRGLPQSKRLARSPVRSKAWERLGLRRPSGALRIPAKHWSLTLFIIAAASQCVRCRCRSGHNRVLLNRRDHRKQESQADRHQIEPPRAVDGGMPCSLLVRAEKRLRASSRGWRRAEKLSHGLLAARIAPIRTPHEPWLWLGWCSSAGPLGGIVARRARRRRCARRCFIVRYC